MDILLVPATTHGRVLVRAASPARGVLVGFHGYMENAEAQMARLESIPATDGWTLVSIQGLHRFYRGRSDAVVSGWMVRQDRETLIADNIAYVDAALASIDIPPAAPIVFAGFSQGVAMAFRAAVRGRFRSAGVIGVGGDIPPELLADPGSDFPPALLMRGNREDWYTDEKMRADVEALKARGVPVEPIVYEAGHEWTHGVSSAAGRFLGGLAEWEKGVTG
jgi:predicted esterase